MIDCPHCRGSTCKVPWGTEANPKYPNCIFKPYTAPRAAEAGEDDPLADKLPDIMDRLRIIQHAASQAEAMREAIRRNVGRMRDDMKLRGYLRVGTLTSALDALSQSLNPKNEEGKTAAAPDELRKAYFEGYEDALKDRSAPAEVAEGAPDMELKKLIENAPVGDFGNELRAAPSLSREEYGLILLAIAGQPGKDWEALTAKVREAAKSHP